MKLQVDGITCGHCERAVTAAITALDPGATVVVDRARKRVEVEGAFSVAAASAAVEAEGYQVAVLES